MGSYARRHFDDRAVGAERVRFLEEIVAVIVSVSD